MEDVITLSSEDSDSDVEVVGCVPPESSVRDDVTDVKVPECFVDLSDPPFPGQKRHKRQMSTTVLAVLDLTGCDTADGSENLKVGSQCSVSQEVEFEESTLKDSAVFMPQQVCGDLKPERNCLDPQKQTMDHKAYSSDYSTSVGFRQMPFLTVPVKKLRLSGCSVHLSKDLKPFNFNNDAPQFMSTTSIFPYMEPSLNEVSPQFTESVVIDKQQEKDIELTSAEFHDLAAYSSHHSPTARLNPSEPLDPDSLLDRATVPHDLQVDLPPTFECTLTENVSEHQSEAVKAERASNSPASCCYSMISDATTPVLKSEAINSGSENGEYIRDMENNSPGFLFEQENVKLGEEDGIEDEISAACHKDENFVCIDALRERMAGAHQISIHVGDTHHGQTVAPQVLCRQSLSLVYSTIDEDYTEGTLQLLSGLLQPGYYPPRDITNHLLHKILLNPKCLRHHCVQAFELLMKTQRYHVVDRSTTPWNWEMLTSVMDNEEPTRKHRCEVVRMFLEYAVQTLEDDLHAKRSVSAVHSSIAKATMSCNDQFAQVRDVIKWLFSAITKATELGMSRERDEQIRMVSVFQRMLVLALEVDHSPVISSMKLAQELFHMLISKDSLRAHRTLLLESMQNKTLRYKLLEHMLDNVCPQKTSLPMSLSLLLHFLRNCTLAPDPMDGGETWRKWEELVHCLWMLLFDYSEAMKGILQKSVIENSGRVSTKTFKPQDNISRSAVLEAMEAFLSRSQDDTGQELPHDVQESLHYLQDHLLDVCQE